MQNTTQTFLNLQAENHSQYYRKTFMQKRYWDGSEYIWQTAEDISRYIIKYGKATKEVSERLNEWKTGNMDLFVDNRQHEWNRQIGRIWHTGVNEYIPEFSIIYIEFGYVDDNGSEHGLNLFRGVIARNGITEYPDIAQAKIHLTGFQSILSVFSAEELPDNVITGESIGTGNGSPQTFNTSNDGVGLINAVYFDSVLQDASTDYEVDSLNDPDNPADIIASPGAAVDVTCDYVYWYQDQTIKFLVEKLLDHANITDFVVQDVNFPNNIETTITYDTKAEWDSGTKERVYTEAGEDNLYLDMFSYYRGSYDLIELGTRGIIVGGQKHEVAQSFEMETNGVIGSVSIQASDFEFGGQGSMRGSIGIYNDNAGNPGTIIEEKTNILININNFTEISGFSTSLTAGTTYWLIINNVREYTGEALQCKITNSGDDYYSDGVVKSRTGGAGAWTLHSSATAFCYIEYSSANSWMSGTIDGTISLQSWGAFTSIDENGIFKYYTLSKAADAGWPVTFDPSEWDEVIGGVIQSSVQRYIRFATVMEFNNAQYTTFKSPTFIQEIEFKYYTSSFDIKLANFTSKTVLSAIEELAELSGYVFGFKDSGQFFFKKLDSGSAIDMAVNGVAKIKYFGLDWSRLVNKITATFGIYSYTLSPVINNETEPHSINKYGTNVLSMSGGALLLNEGVNVAKGLVEQYYNDYGNTQKNKCISSGKTFMQLELTDSIQLIKYEAGDLRLATYDDIYNSYLYGDAGNIYSLTYRILKIIIDPEKMTDGGMELILSEV